MAIAWKYAPNNIVWAACQFLHLAHYTGMSIKAGIFLRATSSSHEAHKTHKWLPLLQAYFV
ncbi:hypothetical protein EMPG_12851 [Blastomyces silverae]|uniref:Uncharacterized protein n=1 Tax=Blastomyces silverae TaxID=2060906 RepID=A0A0H1BS81_9EURO|nr:hypothetical protein EMPG_12851 [Blastomyces silverae]